MAALLSLPFFKRYLFINLSIYSVRSSPAGSLSHNHLHQLFSAFFILCFIVHIQSRLCASQPAERHPSTRKLTEGTFSISSLISWAEAFLHLSTPFLNSRHMSNGSVPFSLLMCMEIWHQFPHIYIEAKCSWTYKERCVCLLVSIFTFRFDILIHSGCSSSQLLQFDYKIYVISN